MNASLIEIKHLRVNYEGRTVLHDVNLTVYARDFLALTGPNGGGKTTLVRCILGLLRPTEGTVSFHPQRQEDGRKLRIGYLPQYSRIDRSFPITVEEVVLSGLGGSKSLTASYNATDRDRAHGVMARMGLEGLGDRAVGTLSGGQLQRTLLGRAVIADPEVLILDEPDTYMDSSSEARLYELLEELHRACAVILVSHDADVVKRLATRVAVVRGGLVQMLINPSEYLRRQSGTVTPG